MSADKFEYRELRQRGIEEFKKIDHNIRLGEMINKTLPSIINFNTKSREEIEKYQLNKLSKLVDYAFENIPLYKKKYSEVGFKSGDIRSFADFERLPILYKDELIDGFPSQIVKNLDDYKYSTRSSGSGGRFVTVAVDLNAIYIDTLQGIRQFLFQSDYRFTPDDVVLFIYTCPWWITDINGKYKLDFLPTTTNPSKALDYIKGIRPTIISTYPTYLQSLCEQRIKLSDYGVKCVIVHSEQSNKNFREEIDCYNMGFDAVSIEPTSLQEYSLVSYLNSAGQYRVPWLWSLQKIVSGVYEGMHAQKLDIRLGGYFDEEVLSGSQGEGFAERNEIFPFETSSNCSKCSGKFIENIKLFNITNDIEVLYNIEKCETCYEQWENACSIKDERSICKRIFDILGK